jgi:hypothetical protein
MSYHPEENSKPAQRTYNYYENGRLKEELAFINDGPGFRPTDSGIGSHRKVFLYNSINKVATTLFYDSNGAFAGFETTDYDTRGNEVKTTEYGPTGVFKSKTKYSYLYDRFGNWTVQKTYEGDTEIAKYQLSEISYQIIEYRKLNDTRRMGKRGPSR